MQKKVRTGKAVEAEVEVPVEVATTEIQAQVTTPAEANTEKNTERKEGQRRNRRSPRHLRASGQRRRRRERRPVNPARLFSGVASPEMAMGKAYPDYARILEMKQARRQQEKFIDNETQNAQDQASQTTTVKGQIGGVAFPEMAMGKVLLPYVPANEAEAKTVAETPVVEHVNAEVPVATTQAEAPVINEVPATAEALVAEQKVEVKEAPVTPAEIAVVEASAPTTTVVAEKPQYKGHASSGMTKATGPTEIKEITVTAAAFRTERFDPKQAGSQTATSQASAAMAKTAGL